MLPGDVYLWLQLTFMWLSSLWQLCRKSLQAPDLVHAQCHAYFSFNMTQQCAFHRQIPRGDTSENNLCHHTCKKKKRKKKGRPRHRTSVTFLPTSQQTTNGQHCSESGTNPGFLVREDIAVAENGFRVVLASVLK